MADPILTGYRNEAWRVDVFTNAEKFAGQLDGIDLSGSFDYSIHNTIRSGGSMTYKGNQDIDWDAVRLQPWYMLKNDDEEVVMQWPLGMFIVGAPKTSYGKPGRERELQLYDKMLILDQDKADQTWAYDKGTNVIAAVKSLIRSTADNKIAIPDSTLTLSAPMVWDVDTPKLKIVNDLLDSVNYFSLWVDGYGVFRSDPYISPSSRGIAWEFIDNDESIYSPEFTHDADYFSVPNKYACVQKTEGDVEGAIAVATNEDPSSPFSYQRRGRWITRTETDVEATTAAILGDIAARKLLDASQVASKFEIKHAPLNLDLNSRVVFRNEEATLSFNAVVEALEVSMGTGELMTATIRQVV